MKKRSYIIYAIIVLLSVVMLIPCVSAESYLKQDLQSEIKAEILAPSDNYMRLSNPVTLATDGTTLICANNSDIFISDANGYGKYLRNITVNYTGFSIKKILIVSDIIIALITDNIESELLFYDIATLESVNVECSDINTSAIVDITEYKDGFLAVIGSDLYGCSIVDNAIIKSQIKLTFLNTANSIIESYDDNIYFYLGDVIYLLDKIGGRPYQIGNITADAYKIYNYQIYAVKNECLSIYDITDNGIKLNKDYKISGSSLIDITVAGERIYLNDTVSNRIYIYNINSQIIEDYYGDKGSEPNRLDSPVAMTINYDTLYIADNGNNRIVAYDLNTVTVNNIYDFDRNINVSSIAKSDAFLYVAEGNIIYVYSTNTSLNLVNTVNLSAYGQIKDLEYYKDTLIALTIDGKLLFIESGGNITEAAKDKNVEYITLSQQSNNLYFKEGTTVFKYNLSQKSVKDTTIPIDKNEQFMIDYNGNVFVYSNEIIKRYDKNNSEYTLTNTFDIDNIDIECNAVMHANSGDILLLNKNTHRLFRVKGTQIGSSPALNIDYEHPAKDLWDVIRVGYIKGGEILLASPDNTEAVRDGVENDLFLALSEHSYNGIDFYYGIVEGNDKFEYIRKSGIDIIENVVYNNSGLEMTPLWNGVEVFEFPYDTAQKIATIDVGTKINALELIAGNEKNHIWKWYKVSLSIEGANKTAYIKDTDIAKATPISPPKNKEYYKVKASKIGVNVKIYRDADINSEVIADNITDGSLVLLLEEWSKDKTFIKVEYGEYVGYILTENLIHKGLTTNQIIAIVLSCSAVVIFAIITVLLIRRKKMMRRIK